MWGVKTMLELVLLIIILIMSICIIVMYRDIKSKNYVINKLRETLKDLSKEL